VKMKPAGSPRATTRHPAEARCRVEARRVQSMVKMKPAGSPRAATRHPVLYVPEADKNLISPYCIGKDGYQVVLPSDNATFPPDVYCPRPARRPLKADSAQQPRYIPLQLVNGLNYVSNCADMGSVPPLTRSNQVIVFSRKLGHMPLETL
jgi:hypothetical protein